jgi:hypothetical protein
MAELPDEVDRFIVQHVDTLEQLEILLLLRSNSAREFSADQVTAELRLGPATAPARLADQAGRGFLGARGEPPRYRYAPSSSEIGRQIDALAHCYSERRVAVITRIFSPRTDPIRSFADAFKLRRR